MAPQYEIVTSEGPSSQTKVLCVVSSMCVKPATIKVIDLKRGLLPVSMVSSDLHLLWAISKSDSIEVISCPHVTPEALPLLWQKQGSGPK